jgi:phage tail P2-like protein
MELSNISILNLMPPNLASDPKVKMAAEAFDEVLRNIITKIPNVAVIPNLVLNKTVDAVLVDLLAWQFHVDFYDPKMPVEVRRDLVLKSLDWHFHKGTPFVVEEIVMTVFSKAMIQEWFEYGGLPYHFRIGIEDELPDEATRENLYKAINSVKNTRSFLDKTTPLLYFEDEFNVTDYLMIIVNVNGIEDIYKKRFQFNGAAKFDGHTANQWVASRGKFSGLFRFNGNLKFGGVGRLPALYQPTFKFSSGVVDRLVMEMSADNFNDQAEINEITFIGIRKHHHFNGAYQFNGTIKFDGMKLIPLG